MTAWTSAELNRIGSAEELKIAPLRRDGTRRKPVIVWVARAGDALYVRSGYGQAAAWFRATKIRGEGRVSADGIEKDVIFEDADPALNDQIDAAYRDKYRRHAEQYISSIMTAEARSTTIRLVPR